MSATAGATDSNLSGQPSDNIDQQKGPSQGSNAESPGGTLGTATTSAQSGSSQSSGNNAQQQPQQQQPQQQQQSQQQQQKTSGSSQ